MRKVSFLLVGMLALAACKKEGCTDEKALNYVEKAKKDDGSCEYEKIIVEPEVQAPTSYKFERDGESTVSFSGQSDRLDMLSEMVSYMKTTNTSGTSIEAAKLLDMYGNENSPFSNPDLNASTKQLKNKTAGDDPTIIAEIEALMKEMARLSDSTEAGKYEGAEGKAGVVQSGTKAYFQNEKGQEFTQLIEKGLMGAVFMHQISFVYLGASKMDVDNEAKVEGKSYTKMEHHWDEAFGYMFGTVNYPTEGTGRFWGKYTNGRDDFLGSNEKLMNAFIKGRFAITQKDMTTRDAQIVIIREELEKVCAATAIHYLNSTKSKITDDALRNHALSEAWAFIGDLKYAKNGKLSASEIEAHKSKLGDNFYAVKAADLTSVRDALAATYGLESIKEQL